MNVNTIYFCGALLGVLMALLMGFVYLNLRTHRGFRSWLFSIVSISLSLIFLWLYPVFNHVGIIVLSNLFQILSPCLALQGTERFLGRRTSSWLFWGPLVAGFATNLFFAVGTDHRALRILCVTVALAVPLLTQIRLIWTTPSAPAIRATLRCLLFFNFSFLVLLAGRSALLLASGGAVVVPSHLVQETTYVVVIGCHVGYFFAYLALNFARTLSEQKATEEMLRASEDRFRDLVETTDAIVWEADAATLTMTAVSANVERLLGYPHADWLQPGFWVAHLHPEDRDRAVEQYLSCASRLQDHALEYRFLTSDGRTVWLRDEAKVILEDGKLRWLRGLLMDITARQTMEQARVRSLSLMSSTIESTTDGILVVNSEGTIEIFNRTFARMWRLPEDVLDTRDDRQAIRLILDQLSEPEVFTEKVQYLYGHPQEESFDVIEFKDGRVFERYSRPQWVGAQVVGRVWSFRDTTARRQAEAERAQLEAQLRHSQKLEAVGTLAGGIAHDFNNILHGIYGYLGLAQRAAPPESDLQGYLEEIRRASQRAADLVRQILAFSRLQGGDQTKTPLALGRIVEEAVKLLRAASPPTIEIDTSLEPDLPAVLGNATQLHQVIMNLGTNAIQAMPEYAGRLSLDLQFCTVDDAQARTLDGLAAGPCLCLTVTDTGVGMDAATLERVFEPFFTTKAPGEGTGLGLSVVHGIVGFHEGAIRLSSEVGRGTSFEIFLPAHLAEPAAPLPTSEVIPLGHGERLLIVDDEVSITRTWKRALEHLGYRVETENNAMDALVRLSRDPQAFDLVLTDQIMPDMTGLELAERLRELRPDLPVILTSGNSLALTPERTQPVGVREVLPKPYTVTTLVGAVQRNLPPTAFQTATGS